MPTQTPAKVHFNGLDYTCSACGQTGIKNQMAAHAHVRWCKGVQGLADKLRLMQHPNAAFGAASNAAPPAWNPLQHDAPTDAASQAASSETPPPTDTPHAAAPVEPSDPTPARLQSMIVEQAHTIQALAAKIEYLSKLEMNHLNHLGGSSYNPPPPPQEQPRWWKNPWAIAGIAALAVAGGYFFGRASVIGQDRVLSEVGQAIGSAAKKTFNKAVDRGAGKLLRGTGL